MAEPKFYRYEITRVFGCMKGRLGIGGTLVHTRHGKSYTWRVFDINAVKAKGGFSGKLLGSVTEPDVLLKLTGST